MLGIFFKQPPVFRMVQIGNNSSNNIILNVLPIPKQWSSIWVFYLFSMKPYLLVLSCSVFNDPGGSPSASSSLLHWCHSDWSNWRCEVIPYLWTRFRWQCESKRQPGQRLSAVAEVEGGAFSLTSTNLSTLTTLLSCLTLLLLLSLCYKCLLLMLIIYTNLDKPNWSHPANAFSYREKSYERWDQ